MNRQILIDTAEALIDDNKGLVVMDESASECNKRFAALGLPQTEETRRTWRELIITTPYLGECISGIIFHDETIRQQAEDGTPLIQVVIDNGIIAGIRADTGEEDMTAHPGEKLTQGLDGLGDRLAEYLELGVRFAKWRAVIAISEDMPSRDCLEINAHALASFAALCQQIGVLPVIELEVLVAGEHTLTQCSRITERVLETVFSHLNTRQVILEGIILMPGMVLPGLSCPRQASVDEVADITARCLLGVVPVTVPGVMFLSGGQTCQLASARLNAMNLLFKGRLPWALGVSFDGGIQQPALQIWRGEVTCAPAAQQALFHRTRCNRDASRGEYTAEIEGVLSPAL